MSASPVTATAGPNVQSRSAAAVHYDSHSMEEYTARWDAPMGLGEMAVSVPMTERLFGQGAQAEFSDLTVTSVSE